MKKTKIYQPFQFKQFTIEQDKCAMKIGTDGVLLGAWCNNTNCKTALDIGTGTGVIAIMIAQRTEQTLVYGVEIDNAAYEQAKNNMLRSPWANRLTAIHGNIQHLLHQLKPSFDLVVSNPPYFSDGTPSLDSNKNAARHTVMLTHSNLLRICSLLLSDIGKICLILPFEEGMKCIEVAKAYSLCCTKINYVKSRIKQPPERVLLQFEKNKNASYQKEESELIIYKDKEREYTADYIKLTKEFYLNM